MKFKKYRSAKSLWEEGEKYFNQCIIDQKVPTVTGLCLFLGFAHRSTLALYRSRDEFKDVVNYMHSLIEQANLDLLYDTTELKHRVHHGNITFLLKAQFGYKETSVVENVNKDKEPEYDYSKIAPDKVNEFMEMLDKAKIEDDEDSA